MSMGNSRLDEFLKGAFCFKYENGFTIEPNPNLEHKSKIRSWFSSLKEGKLSEDDKVECEQLYLKLFTQVMPNEPLDKVKKFLMIHEDETTFLFWKHFNWIKVNDNETYTQWNDRMKKTLEDELKKKENQENLLLNKKKKDSD